MPFDQRSLIHWETWFPPCLVKKKSSKKPTSKQKCLNVTPLLSITFLQGFRISKNIGHPTSESGGKKTVKRYLKSEHTQRQTNTQTDIWTFRLIESIGPEGRCFENSQDILVCCRPSPLEAKQLAKSTHFLQQGDILLKNQFISSYQRF